ncbi:MAG: nucleotidyltransferase family protein [Ignavibacteria bacterium]|nr:nucleotidyltransferase family protein [Ignavibacteria bacterium]
MPQTLTTIRSTLALHKQELCDTFFVRRLAVFGSVASGMECEDSDIDMLVEFTRPVGWEIFDLNDYLEQLLQRKIDLTTPAALKPLIREEILHKTQEVYSA